MSDTAMEARTMDSAFHQFTVDYEQTKDLAIGMPIHSDAFSAGGHMWRVKLYPRGNVVSDNGMYLSIFLELLNKSSTRSVNAICEAFMMDKNGQPSSRAAARTGVVLFQRGDWGWHRFISLIDLETNHITEGHFKFVCAVMVVSDSSIPMPPSDFGKRFGMLLDDSAGTDVSFSIDGETFRAHRAVLAAHSPVFRAELLGSMAEAKMSSITLHGITPATFRVMLRFMYTDAFPGDDELGDSPTKMLIQLLAASDRYALDRLKIWCAKKLWDSMSVNTACITLVGADMYSCPELKNKCLDFIVSQDNSRFVCLTKAYFELTRFPHLIAELRQKVRT